MMRWWGNEVFNKRRSASEDEVFKMKTDLILTEDEEISDELKGLKKYIFRVEASTSPMERVCVTGSCLELGSWEVDKMILLNREGDSNRWSGEVLLQMKETLDYAYVIVTDDKYRVDALQCTTSSRIKSIRHWEAGNSRRITGARDELSQLGLSNKFNYLSMTAEEIRSIVMNKYRTGEIDKFGIVNGQSRRVNSSWLTTDSVLQLKLFENNLRFFAKELKHRPIFTKFRTINLKAGGVEDEDFCEELNHGWPVVEVSVLDDNRRPFTRQDSFGTPLCEGDTTMVHIYHDRPLTLGIVLDFYCRDQRLNKILHVGFACIHPCTLSQFEGDLNLDIKNVNNQPVGDIKIEYLTIHHTSTHNYNLSGSLLGNWENLWIPIDDQPQEATYDQRSVIKICSETRDNTLASIKETVADGADFVEINVQLTKDGIPVFAHNPYLVVVIKNPDETIPIVQYQVKVDKFTLPQLQRLKIHPIEKCDDFLKLQGKTYSQDSNNIPFPTLTHILNGVEKNVGFIIDVSNLSVLESGSYPKYHNRDINDDLDKILKMLHQSAGRRIIVLASFLPDVCTMLRFKQNEYPVIFLREGIPNRCAAYDQDLRCRNFKMAVDFAVAMEISGVGITLETLMNDYNSYMLQKNRLITMVVNDSAHDGELLQHMNRWKLNGFSCRRRDRYGLYRRTFAYLLEPKDKEICSIREWAEDVEKDGIAKPRIHPLKSANLLFPELTMKPHNESQSAAPVLPLNTNLSLLTSGEYSRARKSLDLSD